MRCRLFFRYYFAAVLFCNWHQVQAGEITITAGERKLSFFVLKSDSTSCILPFNRVGKLIVLKARVDTTEGNFILDTGAPNLVLNMTYFRDYPMEVQSDGEQTSIAGRGDYIYKTMVKELTFGVMLFHRLEADITNLGNIENARGLKVLGLLGLNLFLQCEMFIDFEKNQIYLRRIGKKESASYSHKLLDDTAQYRVFPIEYTGKRMITTTEVAGKKLKLVIDCAAESNIIDSRLPDKIMELITITSRVKLAGPGDNKVDALYGNLASMKIGTQLLENLPVVIINLEYTCFNDDLCINGVLGFDFLSQHKIGFNFVKRKMYIWK
jgi:hypothetical protein